MASNKSSAKTELLSGGDMLIRALQEMEVDYIFGYPGGSALHIYDAIFRQTGIEHVLVRHEQAATHMADAYARATGKVGVVLVTSGPGATNAITGIATAHMDSIPMIVISGQVPSPLIGTDAFQETDMIGISRPVVKHSFLISECGEIPSVVKKAFHIACSGRPGPVVIDVPKDTTDPAIKAKYDFPKSITLRSYSPPVRGSSGQIRKAAEILMDAKRPVIYAGGGVIQGEASQLLTRLAKALHFPVTNTLMGLGAYPGDDPQFLGMLGMHGTYEANMAMHKADTILALGARFDDRITNEPALFCPGSTIIHVDVDPASISKIIKADVPIVGEVKNVLEELCPLLEDEIEKNPERVDTTSVDKWWAEIADWKNLHGLDHNLVLDVDKPILPQTVIKALYKVTKGDAYVTSDVGQHQMFVAQYYKFDKPRRWINSGGLGTMGFGFPAAMGVQVANREAVVVCVTGEGSFMMNMQELSTCLQYALPVKIINLNNQALGMVKQWQDMQYEGRHSQSTYSDSLPDFKSLVESFGHIGLKVESPGDLESTLTYAFSDELRDKTVFVDVWVDPDEHVYPMAIKGGSMGDMYLSKTKSSRN